VSREAFAVRLGLLAAVAVGFLLPSADLAPLERAEIYFLDGARTMVESGDWVVPRYRGEPFFDKPPLTYWLVAASFEAFGFTLAAARLAPALAALGTLLASVWLGSMLLDRRRALSGGLALVTTLAFVSFGRIAMSDMLLAFWTTLAVALGVRLYAGAPAWLGPLLGLVLGLGFLTKGPIALILPGLGLALLAWRERGRGLPLSRAWLAVSVAAFAAVSLSWFAAVAARLGAGPLAYFFLHENIERFAGETYDSGRAFWYYLPTYLAEGAPWSLFLPPALLALRRITTGREAPAPALSGGPAFLFQWLLLMLVPLSLSRGKIDYYLLPLYPAASLLVGAYLHEGGWSRAERIWGRFVLLAAAASLALAPLVLVRFSRGWLPPKDVRPLLVAGAAVLALVCLAAAARFTAGRARAALAVSAGAAVLAGTTLFLPAFRAAQPNQAIVDDVSRERRFRPDARLVMCEDPVRVERDLLFWERTTPLLRCDLLNPASSRLPFLLLVPAEQRPALAAVEGLRFVGEYRYLPATALTFDGIVRGAGPARLVLLANYPSPDLVAEWRVRRDRRRAYWDELEARERGDTQGGPAVSPGAGPSRDP
jgi:4-amino-4-deoxy-L-arabinose transferase-like glycosyltransferase